MNSMALKDDWQTGDPFTAADANDVADEVNGLTSALAGKANVSHTHSAADVTSGTLDAARVPNLNASKITSGTLDAARIPTVEKSKLAGGVQTSLDKADSAVQPGTAGSVVVGSLPGSGVANVLYVVP